MRLVAALFAVKIALAVASRGWRLTRTVLRHEALHRGPGHNLRAVDGKVLVRKQRTNLFVVEKLGQELVCHLGVQQPVAVLRKHGRHPHRIIHAKTDEPAIEQIVVELLHQLAFRADCVKRLQQKRPQKPLRRDRRSPLCRVELRKFTIEVGEHLVNDASDQPQRMVRGHSLFEVNIGEQFTRPHIRSAHRFLLHPLVSVGIKFAIECQRQATFFSSLLV